MTNQNPFVKRTNELYSQPSLQKNFQQTGRERKRHYVIILPIIRNYGSNEEIPSLGSIQSSARDTFMAIYRVLGEKIMERHKKKSNRNNIYYFLCSNRDHAFCTHTTPPTLHLIVIILPHTHTHTYGCTNSYSTLQMLRETNDDYFDTNIACVCVCAYVVMESLSSDRTTFFFVPRYIH